MSATGRVQVAVEIDEGEQEELWCVAGAEGTCVVDEIPKLACGISVGDTLRVAKTKKGLVAEEIVGKSGRCTLTAYPESKQVKSILARVKSLAGAGVAIDEEALALDVPNDDALVLLTGWLDDAEIEYEVSDPIPDDDGDETDEGEGEDADDVGDDDDDADDEEEVD